MRRGHSDEEVFITATILGRGGCVVMYCEVDGLVQASWRSAPSQGSGDWLWKSNAAVVPVAIYGSQRVRNCDSNSRLRKRAAKGVVKSLAGRRSRSGAS